VPEWQATVDALHSLPEIGVEAPIGYAGVRLGVVTGRMLTAIESRIAMIDGIRQFGAVHLFPAAIRPKRVP
jgi:hypothetical protein